MYHTGQAFRQLPELKQYFSSYLFDLPVNNKHATFGAAARGAGAGGKEGGGYAVV